MIFFLLKVNARHMLNALCITIIYISYNPARCEEVCEFIDYLERPSDDFALYCSKSSVCYNDNDNFTISYIETPPFTSGRLNELDVTEVEYLLKTCCGTCTKSPIKTFYDSLADISMNDMKSSDFVYPILARASTTKLYGMHYIPHYVLSKVSVFYFFRVFIKCGIPSFFLYNASSN